MLPTTTPIATQSASRSGEMPCLNKARRGSIILRYSQFFTGMFNDTGIRRRLPVEFVGRHGADPVEPLQSMPGRKTHVQ